MRYTDHLFAQHYSLTDNRHITGMSKHLKTDLKLGNAPSH
jgi:hypothetical protein